MEKLSKQMGTLMEMVEHQNIEIRTGNTTLFIRHLI